MTISTRTGALTFCAVLAICLACGWAGTTLFTEPGSTVTTYEACKEVAGNGEQSGCEPAAPANATRVRVVKHAT